MSKRPEALELLTAKLEKIRQTINLVNLLDSMSFFAVTELLQKIEALQQEIQNLILQSAGGFIKLLENKVTPKLTNKVLNSRMQKIFTAS